MKKVSIIVPVYNLEQVLGKCIADFLSQTYPNIEIILVDDGSIDNTLQVCHEFARRDERIKVVHTDNQGCGMSRNTGAEQADGHYVYFMDADDNLEADAIEVMVDTMERDNSDLVICGHKSVNSEGRVFYSKSYASATVDAGEIRRNYGKEDDRNIYTIQRAVWNKMFVLNKIKQHNIRFPNVRRHAEEIFVTRYLDIADRVSFIDRCFYTYNKDDYQKILGKLPVDYIDEISRTMRLRMDLFAAWNPDNQTAFDLLREEYTQRLFRALELSFHPKMNFDRKERLGWLKEVVDREEVQRACASKRFDSRYRNTVCALIRAKKVHLLYFLLELKTRK
ncbi:MAG TPA: glycosyltransferase family 2 protein [Syntrophomonadaceae bacterium]|nr:glycosyltransferase family 2 protein [Syntrophomonadaceae bacterium]HPR92735.1 glycosyltransferase family 2 protein [Syntrophomonadaceae bacterium]